MRPVWLMVGRQHQVHECHVTMKQSSPLRSSSSFSARSCEEAATVFHIQPQHVVQMRRDLFTSY